MQDGVLAIYDTDAPQPPGFGGYGRTLPGLLFPNITRWDQIFERWTPDRNQAPPPYVVEAREVHYTDRQRRHPHIGPYLMVDTSKAGGTRYGSLWVRAHLPVYQAIEREMIPIRGDTISFNVVAWDPQRAVVVAQYSQILGDHWLAIIDPASIPEEVRHAQVS